MDRKLQIKYHEQLVTGRFNADLHIGYGNVAEEIAKSETVKR
jgi:hypothetical protein